MSLRSGVCLVLLLLAGSLAAGYEQKGNQAAGPNKGNAVRDADLHPLTPQQEAETLEFVRANHVELADLLGMLKASKPSQYDQAIRDLHKSRSSLSDIQERDPVRYELDLKAWRIGSRIRVLAARLSMGPNASLEAELKTALLEQVDVRLTQRELERERLTSRLERLETLIRKTRESREQEADRALERLKRSVAKSSSSAKRRTKTASSANKPTRPAPNKTNQTDD